MAFTRTQTIGSALGVAVLGGFVTFNVTKDSRNRVLVQTEKVSRADLVSIVSASGEIKPKRYVNISANVPGRIVQMLVKEGDTVRKGQVLCRIEATRYDADARQAEAGVLAEKSDLERALADLEASRLAFERTQKMHKDQLVSEQAYDQAVADYKMKAADVASFKRRITQQEAGLESTRDNLEKTTVVSTMDGVVTNLDKEEGEMVIGAQSFQPTVIMTVADLSIMEVEVLVDETDFSNVRVGQAAEVRVDALEGVKIKGEVTDVGSSAIPRGSTTGTGTTTTNTGNQPKDFKVKVTLKDPPSSLRPGLNATADITTATKHNVLSVPIQAVVVRAVGKDGKVLDPVIAQASGGEPTPPSIHPKGEEKDGVFVVSNAQANFTGVKTGVVGETQIEILDGLHEGDEIVVGSYKTLRTLENEAHIKLETKKEKS
jgi:HlyD family secretion protein